MSEVPLSHSRVAVTVLGGPREHKHGFIQEIQGYLTHKWGVRFLISEVPLYRLPDPESRNFRFRIQETAFNRARKATLGL
jgi:hypothetical protein